jgi:hypothetical protein
MRFVYFTSFFINFLFFLLYLPCVKGYITKPQWSSINYCLNNKNKYTKEDMCKIQKIIYVHYEKWAFYKTYQFKSFHFHKCKHIKQQELNLYASVGLNKAIQNYNPNKSIYATFSVYALHYIISELYSGMTELQPITILAKSERKKNIYKRNLLTQNIIPIFVGYDDYMFDLNNKNTNNDYNDYKKYEELWRNIYLMDIQGFTKTIIKYKYSFDFKVIRTNKEIAELFGYSEEYIRQHINKFKAISKNL